MNYQRKSFSHLLYEFRLKLFCHKERKIGIYNDISHQAVTFDNTEQYRMTMPITPLESARNELSIAGIASSVTPPGAE